MKSIYMLDSLDTNVEVEDLARYFYNEIKIYVEKLKIEYELKDEPAHIIWTSKYVMENVLQKNIPAYTNEKGVFISIDLDSWKEFLTEAIQDDMSVDTKTFFDHYLKKEILCILGHEITHHCDFFLSDFDDEDVSSDDLWFEEGLVMFLPRFYFYTEEEFSKIYNLELELFNYYKERYDEKYLEAFTYDLYENEDTNSIMFHYWKSFLAITDLVFNHYNKNIHLLIEDYHSWDKGGRNQRLSEYLYKIKN